MKRRGFLLGTIAAAVSPTLPVQAAPVRLSTISGTLLPRSTLVAAWRMTAITKQYRALAKAKTTD